MDILRFTLGGKTAFFKKPDVNSYYYFTYGNIHKIALLGIFGAILGYRGYTDYNSKQDIFPEFYDKLKDIQYSIIPKNNDGFIKKKIQIFNNSVGYASQHQGGNLIVKEQWLENPRWEVFVKLDSEVTNNLAEAILNKKCVYVPYLGKNDHPADIADAVILTGSDLGNQYITIDSLFLKELVEYGDTDDYESDYEGVKLFKYEESLPIGLNEDTYMYYYATFVHTNLPIENYCGDVYKVQDKNIVFF
ncbi:MAG: type I-B CRISPR-associated protein Cas5 [Tissierellia bacterium]|nr:type I-B CRISPR-associated protein Cas5 [Tissierellia bacterium]